MNRKALDTMNPEELRQTYRASEPERAPAALSSTPSIEWPMQRELAFGQLWGNRLAARQAVTDEECTELAALTGDSSLKSLAMGTIGDAAKARRLSAAQVSTFRALDLNRFAANALAARSELLALPDVNRALLQKLLEHRGSWAIEELIATRMLDELSQIEPFVTDPGLYRIERHQLREALRRRRLELEAMAHRRRDANLWRKAREDFGRLLEDQAEIEEAALLDSADLDGLDDAYGHAHA
jgi:hypothetical protein